MVVQVVFEFSLLLIQIRKVNKETRAHISFHCLDLFMRGRSVTSTQEVTIFEEPTSSDLFWIFGCNEFFVQVIEGFFKITVHRFGYHGGVKVVRDGCGVSVALIIQEQCIQHNMKGVHTKFILSSHCVNEFELYCFSSVVS